MNAHMTAEELVDYARGMLAPAEDARTLAHVDACGECRAALDAEMRAREALRAYMQARDVELPSTVKAAIWSQIRAARPSPLAMLRLWLRPAIALPAAAAVAAGIYFGTTQLAPRPAPAIEASYYLQDAAAVNAAMPLGNHVAIAADAAE